jgi:hypothetical protein
VYSSSVIKPLGRNVWSSSSLSSPRSIAATSTLRPTLPNSFSAAPYIRYSATINLVIVEKRQNETITTKGQGIGKTQDLASVQHYRTEGAAPG